MAINRRHAFIPGLLGVVLLSAAWAAQPGGGPHHGSTGNMAMSADCKMMAQMRDRMTTKQSAAGARLDHLVVAMNEATGEAKVDAIAAVVNELAKQHTQMHARMVKMRAAMMDHMMSHIMEAAPPDMREKLQKSIDECPMLKSQKAAPSSDKDMDKDDND